MNNIILDLGCGTDKKGNLGLDRFRTSQVDILADINLDFPFKNNSIDKIIANHVLEHSENLIKTMEEIHRVLKPGGIIEIAVPHATSLNAFADPTHKNFFTVFTMNYFTKGSELNYYSNARFEIKKRTFEFMPGWRWLGLFFNLRPEFSEKFLKITPFQVNIHWIMIKQ